MDAMSASERPLRAMRQRTSSVIGSPLLLDLVLSESTIALQPRVAALTRRHSFHHGQRPNLSTLERARAATMSALPLMRTNEDISSDLRRVSEEKDDEVSTPAPSAAGALVDATAALAPAWRDDVPLLERCLRVDADDWRCLDTYAEYLMARGDRGDKARDLMARGLAAVERLDAAVEERAAGVELAEHDEGLSAED